MICTAKTQLEVTRSNLAFRLLRCYFRMDPIFEKEVFARAIRNQVETHLNEAMLSLASRTIAPFEDWIVAASEDFQSLQ